MKQPLAAALFFLLLTPLFSQNWQPMAAGLLPNGVVIFSISAAGDNVVWAVASEEYYQTIPGTHNPRILRTSDGGLNWITAEVEEAAGTISFQIVAVDSLTAWITTQDYGGGPGRALYQTTDGGLNWSKKLNNISGGVALNRFADGQHWLAHNRQATSYSANDGENWTNATISGYQSGEYQLLNSGANMSSTAGDTLWNGTSAGRIVRFTNYGQSVQFFNAGLGTATHINSVAFYDHLNGLCWSRNVLGNNRIARSTDGGATWTLLPQQPGNTTEWSLNAVPGAPGYFVLASNYNFNQGKVAVTTDFGDSWSVENLNQPLNSVVFSNPNTGWIGAGRISSSTQPAMFKYTGSPLVRTKTPADLSGFSISPNPVDDVLRFDFDGFDGAKKIIATIADVEGKQFFSGLIQGKELSVRHLSPGVYFLHIEADGMTGTAKVIKN